MSDQEKKEVSGTVEQNQQTGTADQQVQNQPPVVAEELKPFVKDGKILGKYANTAEALKALEHAQSLIGKKQGEPAAPIPATPKIEPPPEISLDNYKDVLKKAGLSESSVINEIRTDGKLSPASAEALEKVGVARSIQPLVVNSLAVAADAIRTKNEQVEKEAAAKVFGSHDGYLKATQDAARLFDQFEKDAFNALLTNPATVTTGMQALKAAIAAKSGGDVGSTIRAGGQPTNGGTPVVAIKSVKDAQEIAARAKNGDPEAMRIVSSKAFNEQVSNLSPFTR